MNKDNTIMISLNLTPDKIQSLQASLVDNVMHIYITLTNSHPECELCACSDSVVVLNYTDRTYHHLDMFGYPTLIHWHRRRFRCKDCGKTFSEPNPFGPESYRMTYAVLDRIVNALHNPNKTFRDIANDFHVSESLIQLYADSFIRAPRLHLPENLGIDEIHSDMAKYGGSYLCVFVDNKNRCLNEILPNRSKRTLSRHFDSIPQSERDKVKFVTMDMWEPYKDICIKYFRNCEIAVDPFHVVKHLSDGFSRLRIDIMNQMPKDSAAYYLLKSWHKLLESDYNLDNNPKYNSFFRMKMNYRDLYNMLLELNPDLSLAYQLKEMYRDFNRNARDYDCEARFNQILEVFTEANLPCYSEFVNLLQNWKQEILNSFKRPYDDMKQSNALAENINKRLRILIHVANGYSNFDRFRARALFCFNPYVTYSLTQKLSSNKRKGKLRGNYNIHTNSVFEDTAADYEDDCPE
jgi:transposase